MRPAIDVTVTDEFDRLTRLLLVAVVFLVAAALLRAVGVFAFSWWALVLPAVMIAAALLVWCAHAFVELGMDP